MKIASQPPKEVRSAVRVTDDQYSLWYMQPIYLGDIHKEGRFWLTADGKRHVTNRDALAYLLEMRKHAALVAQQQGLVAPVRAPTPAPPQERPISAKKKSAAAARRKSEPEEDFDPELLAQFQAFMRHQKEQRSGPGKKTTRRKSV